DWRVSPRLFPGTGVLKFNPESYEDGTEELRHEIHEFRNRTSPYAVGVYNRLGKVGLALGAGTPEAAAKEAIVDRLLTPSGEDEVFLAGTADDSFGLALAADGCDFVILDLDALEVLPIADFLSGRATPMLKWCHRSGADSPPPRLLGSAPLLQ